MGLVLMILGFIWWWPVGLAILLYLMARRRCWFSPAYAGDGPMTEGGYGMDRFERKMARAQEKVERVRARMGRCYSRATWFSPPSSGNRAFDEYREETLRRLEEEQREFREFLDRLRVAKDRAEFDAFMAARRNAAGPQAPGEPSQG
jgi:hypothetical protein